MTPSAASAYATLRPGSRGEPGQSLGTGPGRPDARRSRRSVWVAGAVVVLCLAIAGASLAWQHAADFDPWGWIVWGREVLHLDLNTVQGPSWKPGAVLLTTVFALFGSAAPLLWLVAARLGALLAVVMAYRVADRLGGRLAGIIAAVLLAVAPNFMRGAIYGASEPLMVAFLLGGLDRALAGRRRLALALLTAASLFRPEVWPVLLLYSAYLWVRSDVPKRWLIGAWALLPVLWFGGDWWGSGDPFLASARAKQFVAGNPWDRYAHPALAVVNMAGSFVHAPALALALVAAAAALVRRRWTLPAVAVGALAMLATAAVMAQKGYPVLGRFLFGTVALAFVLTGAGAGAIVAELRRWHVVAAVAGAVAILAALAPMTVSDVRAFKPAASGARQWSDEVNGLPAALRAAGGRAKVLGCTRSISTNLLAVPALAWDLHVPIERIRSIKRGVGGLMFILRRDVRGYLRSHPRPLRVRTMATTRDWAILYVVRHRHSPQGCASAQ